MDRILIVGFKPFGIIGRILKRNDSELCLKKLKKIYPSYKYLTLPVSDKGLKILHMKLNSYKPDKVFLMGVGDINLRIETKAHNKNFERISELAIKIKNKFGSKYEKIGDYYCNKAYFLTLGLSNCVFVHMPYYVDFKKIKQIFEIFLNTKWKKKERFQ